MRHDEQTTMDAENDEKRFAQASPTWLDSDYSSYIHEITPMADLAAETATLKQTIWGIEAELAYQSSFGGRGEDDTRIHALTDRLRQAHADLKKIERQMPKP